MIIHIQKRGTEKQQPNQQPKQKKQQRQKYGPLPPAVSSPAQSTERLSREEVELRSPGLFASESHDSQSVLETTHSSLFNNLFKRKKKKPNKESDKPKNASLPSLPSPKTSPMQAPLAEDLQPLSYEEQEALAESINGLPERLLYSAMQIIRESVPDIDELDISSCPDVDLLPLKTQRKLQSFVMEVSLTTLNTFLCVEVYYS